MEQLTILIADVPVTLVLDQCDSATRARILEHYQAFIVELQPNALTIEIQTEPGPAFIPVRPGPLQIRTTEHHGRIEFESYFERGFVDRASNHGNLVLRPTAEPENFLRVFYAWTCLDQSALLIHSAGVIRNRRGFVFFGHSGSGKTTLSRLSMEHTVLSDDLVIIKQESGLVRLYGVPFRGDFPEAPRTNATAPLHGIFALAKDEKHFIAPLGIADAVARLASCVPFVMTEPRNAQRVFGICEDLVQRVPVYTLHFARDNKFWEAIDGLEQVSHPA